MSTVQQNLNQANPTTVPDMLRKLRAGDLLAALAGAASAPQALVRSGLSSSATQVEPEPGQILAVASSADAHQTIVGPTVAPGANQVAISYSASGVATLVFNGAVTGYKVLKHIQPDGAGTAVAASIAALAADSGAST
jgi:hypothetical protein